jgi:hypothetical protein
MSMAPWDHDRDGNQTKMLRRQLQAQTGYPANESILDLAQDPILERVWDLMKQCWHENPGQRPGAKQLLDRLEVLSNEANQLEWE